MELTVGTEHAGERLDVFLAHSVGSRFCGDDNSALATNARSTKKWTMMFLETSSSRRRAGTTT